MSETSDDKNSIHALWFDSQGRGPDEFVLELQPFRSQLDGRIPGSLGLRVRVGGFVINGAKMIDGGFNFHRDQVAELHRQLGAWLEVNPS